LGVINASGALFQELAGGIDVGDLKWTLVEIEFTTDQHILGFRDYLAWETAMAISKPTVQFSYEAVGSLMEFEDRRNPAIHLLCTIPKSSTVFPFSLLDLYITVIAVPRVPIYALFYQNCPIISANSGLNSKHL
jgi:hypothetical protein